MVRSCRQIAIAAVRFATPMHDDVAARQQTDYQAKLNLTFLAD